MTWTTAIAKTSGAALGFVLGDLRGAIAGYEIGDYVSRPKRQREDSGIGRTPVKVQKTISTFLSKQKQMPKTTAENKLVNQSSMKKTGSRNLKQEKKVTVSKTLREKVKKVMEGEYAKGSYTTFKTGFIGAVLNKDNSLAYPFPLVTPTVAGFGTTIIGNVCPSIANCTGSRTLWGSLAQNVPTTVAPFVSANFSPNTDFNYFTLGKIVDAASVCFNGKIIDINAYATPGNLSTVFDRQTGLPVPATQGSLKINLKNSWVQFTIRNMSQRVLHLDIFECTPTIKFQDNTALDSLYSNMTGTGQVINDEGNTIDAQFRYFNGSSGSSAYKEGVLVDGTIDAVQIAKQYGFNFSVVKREMVLQPFETCVHSIQGPKGWIDWSKNIVDNVLKTKLMKGFGVSCIFSVRVDQAVQGATNNGTRLQKLGAAPSAGTGLYMSAPIAIEVKESYTMEVPEIAGFIKNTNVNGLGNTQLLNLRKKKDVYANFTVSHPDTFGTGFTIVNENNPTAQIASTAPGTIV